MRVATLDLFDDSIAGTGFTWYSRPDTYQALGRADSFVFQATVYNVTGTTPGLIVQVEHSADAQNWVSAVATPEITTSVVSNNSYQGSKDGISPVLLEFIRLRISLTGTSPQCRLKLTATTRAL
jgi:hypothetical protein